MAEFVKDEELLVPEEEQELDVNETEETVEEVEETVEKVEETVEEETNNKVAIVVDSAEGTPEEKPAKDYTKLSKLAYKLLTLLAFVSAFVAFAGFNNGLVVGEDFVFSSNGYAEYLMNIIPLLGDSYYSSGSVIIPMMLNVMFAVFYVIYAIILIINLIILIFQFLGTIFARKEIKLKYSKFSKRALTFSCLSMAFMAGCLMYPNAQLTSAGKLVLILAAVIYVATNAVVLLFKQLEAEEKNWIDFGFDFGKSLVVLAVVVLFFVAFGKFNLMDVRTYVWYLENEVDTILNGTLISIVVLELWLVTKACKLGRIALKHYALDNGKKPVSKLLKKKSITLIVLTILVLAAKLFLTGALATGDYVNSVMMYKDTYLVLILGAITLLFCLKTNKKEPVEIVRE